MQNFQHPIIPILIRAIFFEPKRIGFGRYRGVFVPITVEMVALVVTGVSLADLIITRNHLLPLVALCGPRRETYNV